MTPFQAKRKIEKAFALSEKAYCQIEDVLRERPGTLPDDLVQEATDAQVAWHRSVKRLLQHVDPTDPA